MNDRAYPTRPIVGIGVCVLHDGCVLLVRRRRPPAQGSWSLPGGAQELGETAETAARREVGEETGIELGKLHLAAVIDSLHHDPAGRLEYHYTIIDYAAEWQSGAIRPGSDVSDAVWAPLDALGTYDLSSEAHRVITRARALLTD